MTSEKYDLKSIATVYHHYKVSDTKIYIIIIFFLIYCIIKVRKSNGINTYELFETVSLLNIK